MSALQLIDASLAQVVTNNGGGGGFVVGGFGIVSCVLALACLALFIWALIDAIGNPRLEGTTKLIWVIVILVLPLLGPILYLVIGRKA